MTASGIPHIYRVELGTPNHILERVKNKIQYEEKARSRFAIEESGGKRLLTFEVTIMLLAKEVDESNPSNKTLIRRKIAGEATRAIVGSLGSTVMSAYVIPLSDPDDELAFQWKLIEARMPECRSPYSDD